jgi:hypothetical protein
MRAPPYCEATSDVLYTGNLMGFAFGFVWNVVCKPIITHTNVAFKIQKFCCFFALVAVQHTTNSCFVHRVSVSSVDWIFKQKSNTDMGLFKKDDKNKDEKKVIEICKLRHCRRFLSVCFLFTHMLCSIYDVFRFIKSCLCNTMTRIRRFRVVFPLL